MCAHDLEVCVGEGREYDMDSAAEQQVNKSLLETTTNRLEIVLLPTQPYIQGHLLCRWARIPICRVDHMQAASQVSWSYDWDL